MQLPLNINIQQILIHLLNFVLLFGILYFLLYKPVHNFMEKRTAEYRETDELINKKLAEATALKTECSERLTEADREIGEMKANAEKEAQSLVCEQIKKAEQQAQNIIDTAKAEAESEKKKIIASAQSEIAEMAAAAAEKIVHSSANTDMFNDFLNSVEEKRS